MYCLNCGKYVNDGYDRCLNCGKGMNTDTNFEADNYKQYLFKTENQILDLIIKEELLKNNVDTTISLPIIEKKKTVFTIIYAVITFILITLTFFHINFFYTIGGEVVVTILYFYILKKYNIVKYLKKQIKSRPDEKMNYVVSSLVFGETQDFSKYWIRNLAIMVFTVIILLVGFAKPRIIYEPMRDGEAYCIRYYTLGVFKNDKELNIPSTYKEKPVVGIRGDVFKNVFTITKVNIPDSVVEIRGGAFQNCSSLESVKLSKRLKEIKGSTFENCTSLKSIEIPDGVMRIGGSAFRNNTSLKTAYIPSTVMEIGSSAFRNTGLSKVIISKKAYVDSKAFKETYVRKYYYEDLGEEVDDERV